MSLGDKTFNSYNTWKPFRFGLNSIHKNINETSNIKQIHDMTNSSIHSKINPNKF